MADVVVRSPTLEDLGPVHVRLADVMEWHGGTGVSFFTAARLALVAERTRHVALVDGRPMVFFGADWSTHGGIPAGRVWMFADVDAERHKLSLHRALLPYLKAMAEEYGLLVGIADARNTKHHEWMEWVGFVRESTAPIPPFGFHYHTYTYKMEV